jgi:protein O-GlcNAc transferase
MSTNQSAKELFFKGLTCLDDNDFANAEAFFIKTLELAKGHISALNNLAVAQYRQRKIAEAALTAREILTLDGRNLAAYSMLSNCQIEQGDYAAGFKTCEISISIDPTIAEPYCKSGYILNATGKYQEALAFLDRAIELHPQFADALLYRGNSLRDLRRFDEALVAYDRALSLNPDLVGAEGFRLNAKMQVCNWNDLEADCEHLIEAVRNNKENTDPFILLSINSTAEDQLNCAGLWTRKRYPPADKPSWRGERYTHGKLRIGYVSADFRQHPVANLVAGVFAGHDRSQFEVTGISIGPSDGSDIRRRLEGSFDTFIDAATLGIDELAQRITEQEIDILIDMNGYTLNARTELFARRPAPIQVNYLGYPGTMGAGYFDYIVADPTLVPASAEAAYAEKIVYLPHSYMPHDAASRPISARLFARGEFGLPENGFVFCCFNNAYKFNPHLFGSQMRILRAVEGSVLWLSEHNATAANNLRREATAAGVDPDRLVFASRLPSSADHLARHRLADLFLDTLPYNAHSTASDALWAGLPVLTQIGETFAGRVAASLLTAVGLPELIARTEAQFESMAVELAAAPAALAAIKDKLAQNRLTKPLFNTTLYTRHIESAYMAMHQRHQAGLPHDHIMVPE